MKKIMDVISVGDTLSTPTGTSFMINAISNNGVTINKRYKGKLIVIPRNCFESIPQFLNEKEWIPIQAIHDKPGVPSTFDWHCKQFTNDISVGSYVAPILEKAGVLRIDRNIPNKVLLIEQVSEPPISHATISERISGFFDRSRKHDVEMETLWNKTYPVIEECHGVITPFGLQRRTDLSLSTSKKILDWCKNKQLAKVVRHLEIEFYVFSEVIETSDVKTSILSSIMIADGGRRPIPKPILYTIVQSGRKDITMVLLDQTLQQMVAEGILEYEPKTNSYSIRIKKTCPSCRKEVDETSKKCEYCEFEFQ